MKKFFYLITFFVFASCVSHKIVYPCDVALYGDLALKNWENRYFAFHKAEHVFESHYKNVYSIGRWEVHSDTLLLMYQYSCHLVDKSDTVFIEPVDSLTILCEIERYLIKGKDLILEDWPQLKYRQTFGVDDYFHHSGPYEYFVPFIK